jgi:hypothetical protein
MMMVYKPVLPRKVDMARMTQKVNKLSVTIVVGQRVMSGDK